MKKIIILVVACFLMNSAKCFEKKYNDYAEVSPNIIKTMPQDFTYKKIKTTLIYRRIVPSPTPVYMEKQFNERRYAIIVTKPNSGTLPIIVNKSTDIWKKFLTLEKNTNIVVYGKTKKFRNEPKRRKTRDFSRAPKYYLEIEHIELGEPTKNNKKEKKVKEKKNKKIKHYKF